MDRSLFKRAIADNDEPISGYMYREMAQWTFKDLNTQTKFITALFEKLKSTSSVHVLFKVLRIIKVMCELGHCEFQKEMQKNVYVQVIKDFASYSGTQDVRHGDGLNEKVRQAAREAIEAIFTHCKEDKLTIQAGHGSNTVEQPSNTNFNCPTVSNREIFLGESLGFCSGRVAPMPATNKWAEHMKQEAAAAKKNAATRVLSALAKKAKNGLGIVTSSEQKKTFKSAKDQLYENVLKLSSTEPNSRSLLTTNSGNFQPVELAPRTLSSARIEASSESSSGWKFIDEMNSGNCVAGPQKTGADSVSSFQQQQQQQQKLYLTPFQEAVHRLCQMKDTPQRVELSAFVTQCHRLGCEMIEEQRATARGDAQDEWDCWDELSEALDAQLAQKQPWQRRLNALAALEALISAHADDTATMAAMRRAVIQYFLENPEDVQRNVLVVQATLKERAQRIVRMLGLPNVNLAGEKSDSPSAEIFLTGRKEQFRGSTDPVNTFSSSLQPPGTSPAIMTVGSNGGDNLSSSAVANMSGLSLRANHRAMKDKTKLRKRATMRFNTEQNDPLMETNNCCLDFHNCHIDSVGKETPSVGFTVTTAANRRNCIGENDTIKGGTDLLDAIFDDSSVQSSAVAQLPPAVAPLSATKSCVDASETTLLVQKNNTAAFDFLAGGIGTNCTSVATGQQQLLSSSNPSQVLFSQQQQQSVTPSLLLSSMADKNLASFGNATTSTAEKSCGDWRNDKNTNGTGTTAVKSPLSLLFPTESSPSMTTTTTKSLPLMIQEMQQQMQSLIINLQRDSDPDALAQLQALVAQQQQIVQLFSRQQEQREGAPPQACWAVSSSSAVCGTNASTVPLHNHFTMGAASSSNSSQFSSSALNALAEMQQELMAKCPASNQHQ